MRNDAHVNHLSTDYFSTLRTETGKIFWSGTIPENIGFRGGSERQKASMLQARRPPPIPLEVLELPFRHEAAARVLKDC